MAHRIFNFNPGPSTLPLDVLRIVQEELLDYKGTGMSVMEISHRSPEYDHIHGSAMAYPVSWRGRFDAVHHDSYELPPQRQDSRLR